MFVNLLSLWFHLCLFAGAIYVILAGGSRERIAVLSYVLIFVLKLWLPVTGLHLFWVNMALDVVFLGALVMLCWKAPHPWPVWAFGFQLLSVMVHVSVLQSPYMSRGTYFTAVTLVAYGVLLALAAGAYGAWRQRQMARQIVLV